MKKKYIKPEIGRKFMVTSSLMTASVEHIHDEEAAKDYNGEGVNFSRQGSFWDDSE